MLDKIKNTINSLLRIHRGTGNQYATHNARETLIETKSFLRRYVKLIVGLFIAVVCVSYASVRLIEGLIGKVVMPFFGNLKIEIAGKSIDFEPIITFVLIFVAVYIIAWALIRKLSGSIEVPQEERAKRCPMCGEQILEIAIRCKHCGSTVGRERTHVYQSSSRESSGQSREVSRQRNDRYPGSRGRPSEPSSDRGDASRDSSQGSSHRSSSDSIHRRRSSQYHARRKDGRYHSRYDQQRNYQQINDQPREQSRSNQPPSSQSQ